MRIIFLTATLLALFTPLAGCKRSLDERDVRVINRALVLDRGHHGRLGPGKKRVVPEPRRHGRPQRVLVGAPFGARVARVNQARGRRTLRNARPRGRAPARAGATR